MPSDPAQAQHVTAQERTSETAGARRVDSELSPMEILRLAHRVLEASINGILVVDATEPDCLVVYANPAFYQMSGYSAQDILGKSCTQTENPQPEFAAIRSAIDKRAEVTVGLRHLRKDGSAFCGELLVSLMSDAQGRTTHFIATLTDVTERKRFQEELAFQVTHDELTGLPNRTLLTDRLQQAMLRTERHQGRIGLLLVDLDRFQRINEEYGYACGDVVLKQVAKRLQGCVTQGDTVAHYLGNRFAALLKGDLQPSQVAAVCERMAQAVAHPIELNGGELELSCSIGIALYPQDAGDADGLARSAHLALHRAKSEGRGKSLFYGIEMNRRVVEQGCLEATLRQALENDCLSLHYQPQVDQVNGRVIGLEALLRSTLPELTGIEPRRLIAIADDAGLSGAVSRWVLRRACQDMRAWTEAGIAVPRIAVNISQRQFSDGRLTAHVEQLLEEMAIEPAMLVLEITEGALMQNPDASEATLRKLKTLGVGLALDDFGTGFSSLSNLKRFPLDLVKIDERFIQDLAGTETAAVSDAIISMAHSLGLRVLAEGVETEAQCEYLRQHMCDEIQGHFFSRPLPAPEVPTLLQSESRLPEHLLRLHKPTRTLLLVDDEANILSALRRLLRRDGYQILTAGSGGEGLQVLASHKVDVIVSDQRMPSMTGVEFLREAKTLYPETVRIVLSGYTELQSVTDAINEGAVYRFLTKPWEDERLREHVAEAFRHKDMADENQRLNLEVRSANQELAAANRQLEQVVRLKQQQISRDEVSLSIVREVLQHIPLPMLGVDEDGMVAFFNAAAEALFAHSGALLGADVYDALPDVDTAMRNLPEHQECPIAIGGKPYLMSWRAMGRHSTSRGRLLSFKRGEEDGK